MPHSYDDHHGSDVHSKKGTTSAKHTFSSSGSTKTYKLNPKDSTSQAPEESLALKYFRIPKSGKDAQFYFFLSTVLLLATCLTIIASCGCLFYFMFKNMFSNAAMMERIRSSDVLSGAAGLPPHHELHEEVKDDGAD